MAPPFDQNYGSPLIPGYLSFIWMTFLPMQWHVPGSCRPWRQWWNSPWKSKQPSNATMDGSSHQWLKGCMTFFNLQFWCLSLYTHVWGCGGYGTPLCSRILKNCLLQIQGYGKVLCLMCNGCRDGKTRLGIWRTKINPSQCILICKYVTHNRMGVCWLLFLHETHLIDFMLRGDCLWR